MHLGELTFETAKAMEGAMFTVTLEGGLTSALKLDEVLKYDVRQRRRKETPRREPFSLYFTGDPALVLPQGMYTLRGEAGELEGLFLVPIGKDGEATEYEAVFN